MLVDEFVIGFQLYTLDRKVENPLKTSYLNDAGRNTVYLIIFQVIVGNNVENPAPLVAGLPSGGKMSVCLSGGLTFGQRLPNRVLYRYSTPTARTL